MKNSAWWTMLVILVGCRSSRATPAQSTCACKAQLTPVCVPPGDAVDVPCPSKTPGDDVKFNLFLNEEMIYNHTCSEGRSALTCRPPHGSAGVALSEKGDNRSVSFVLTGVNASSYGVYRCEGTVMYPPPFVTAQSDVKVLVMVEGHQCNKTSRTGETVAEQTCGFNWIWVIPIISLYSVIVTIVAVVNWVKLRRTDSQSDYINTKPRAPRNTRGIQNPIPRHF